MIPFYFMAFMCYSRVLKLSLKDFTELYVIIIAMLHKNTASEMYYHQTLAYIWPVVVFWDLSPSDVEGSWPPHVPASRGNNKSP